MKIISWNINGAKTKLEKDIVQSVLLEYDIISLNEVKTSLPVSLPGYLAFRSNVNRSAERGGTTVLVKNYLANYVVSVQTDVSDQVWVRFRCIPKCLFGFCYIPPADSEYYSHDLFAVIQEKK